MVLLFATSAYVDEQPTEFVTQVLEPTGGNIVRPKEWFYAEHHHGPVFVWTISREDTSGNQPYTTGGVSIQTFMHVKEGTGKTAEEFLRSFAAERTKEAMGRPLRLSRARRREPVLAPPPRTRACRHSSLKRRSKPVTICRCHSGPD